MKDSADTTETIDVGDRRSPVSDRVYDETRGIEAKRTHGKNTIEGLHEDLRRFQTDATKSIFGNKRGRFVTNGHLLVMEFGRWPDLPVPEFDPEHVISSLEQVECAPVQEFRLANFVSTARPVPIKCDVCSGTGERTCSECYSQATCQDCFGGYMPALAVHGMALGQLVDINLVHMVLDVIGLDDVSVGHGAPNTGLVFKTKRYLGIAMPMQAIDMEEFGDIPQLDRLGRTT